MSECQRCGDEYEWDTHVLLHNRSGRRVVDDDIALCLSCAEDLLEWIEAGEEQADESHQSKQTIDLGLDARIEFEPEPGAMHLPCVDDVTIMRPLNKAGVDAYIPEEVPSYLVVEMGDGAYRIELEDGENIYAIRDGEEVSDDD